VSDKVPPRERGRVPPEWRGEIRDCFVVAAPKVYGFLRCLAQGDRELSADLVQETFKQATESWGELRARSGEGREAWLLQVARNLAVDAFRRAGTRRRKLPQVGLRYQPAEADVHAEAMAGVAIQHFIKVVDAMPRQRALVASLYWRCGWSNGEIARGLGITPGAVSQHLAKARAILKGELSPYVPFDPSGPEAGESG
jgi:RNA polymerase sigma factor (sigma-70 family)